MHSPIHARTISWFEVHEFVQALTEGVGPLPWPGTLEWLELPDDDPRKVAAVLRAGVLWALNESARQEAMAEASQAISAALDWGEIGRQIQQRESFYAAKPWLRRAAS